MLLALSDSIEWYRSSKHRWRLAMLWDLWAKKPAEPPLDEAKVGYEQNIRRCYGYQRVTLALYEYRCFVGFNMLRSFSPERDERASDNHEMIGVVDESYGAMRHLPCELVFSEHPYEGDELGVLYLTHISEGIPRQPKRREEEGLVLKAYLGDPLSIYRKEIVSALRDAAISGLRFIHIGLECSKPADQDVAIAMSKMQEDGYGPSRKIMEIKLWPRLELRNAPAWARSRD